MSVSAHSNTSSNYHPAAPGHRLDEDVGASSFGSLAAIGDPDTAALKRTALAAAFAPIIRGCIFPAWIYYAFIGTLRLFQESGNARLVLAGLTLSSGLVLFFVSQRYLRNRPTLGRLEFAGFLLNLAHFSNVTAYLLFYDEPSKLVYYIILAVVFALSGVTMRLILPSIAISLATLLWFANAYSPALFNQYLFIGLSTPIASLVMAWLLRSAIYRQVEARLKADEMASIAERQAATDPLTGLPNRRSMMSMVERLTEERHPFWLGIVDLDGFKTINDLYGHAVGDTVLTDVAERLMDCNATHITVGRLGGDEFAVVITRHWREIEVESFANTLIEVIRNRKGQGEVALSVGASCGFSHFPTMAADAKTLYEQADFALYKAKGNRRGRAVIFTSAYHHELAEHARIERALREGNLAEELYLVYQPQHDLGRNRIVGFEALARWSSPTIGEVRPDRFIRAAEKAGLIQELTLILFQKGLTAMASWPDNIHLSFNLSAHDICSEDSVRLLIEKVKASGIAPHRIEFEITETSVMTDFHTAVRALGILTDNGCRIALDDFGSGYSSFEYIDQLPLNKIKVDKSFVTKVTKSATSSRIIKAIIELCRDLELDCVLEGVETDEELAILRHLKASLIQGYLFGRPVSEDKAGALLLAA